MNAAEKRDWIVAQARTLGFDLCGVAPAADFEELARMPEWLARGYAGEMRYLDDPRRRSPQAAMPGARSLIVCALNYNTSFPYSTDARVAPQSPNRSITRSPDSRGWISRYAWGDDYHHILGAKLDALLAAMRARFAATPFDARAYVDTGPVHERIAAHHAGLGWLGKNTCLINQQLGSWLFLGVILTTLELEPTLSSDLNEPGVRLSRNASPSAGVGPMNHPMTRPVVSVAEPSPDHPISFTPSRPQGGERLPPDLCGQCTQCLDACPTGALVEPYVLDARRCISYLTIELRGPIPDEFHSALGWHLFGCDICQDVCPYNRRAPVTTLAAFQPRAFEVGTQNSEIRTRTSHVEPSPGSLVPSASLFATPLDQLASLSASDFRSLFRGSAIKRTKHAGLIRNVAIALKNAGSQLS